MGVGHFVVVVIAVMATVITTAEGALAASRGLVDKMAIQRVISNEALDSTSDKVHVRRNLRRKYLGHSSSGDSWWSDFKAWFKDKVFFWKRSKKDANRLP
ncbi:unnamed protein product [Phytophthora lilii]|uniref:Unnamed protein product n=1 Tax=Phytophthora lilii TaxID=2077276 RepID=A0A9W6TEY4_9STRA|nr:unnamed protein product [Phytophthora lilii]